MDIIQPRVSALFDASVAALADSGVTPTAREAVWLHSLCEAVVCPDKAEVCVWLPPVVEVGPIRLCAITVQARLWLENYAATWWRDDTHLDILGTAWAMAHGSKEGAFATMTNRARAEATIAAWSATIPVTVAQLAEGLRRYYGTGTAVQATSQIEPKANDPVDWGELVVRCAYAVKVSPLAVLTWTEDQVVNVLSRMDGAPVASQPAKLRALEALRLAKLKITEAHKAQ